MEPIVMLTCFLLGAIAVTRGAALYSPPAGWIVAGLWALVLAAWPLVRGRGLR